jgi:hypothetical protein
VFLAVLACQGGPAQARATPAAAAAPPAAADQPYYGERELRAMAAKVTALKKDRLLVCGAAAGTNCVCVEPLPCESQGNCVSFQENVEAFRRALTDKTQGRSVECRRAEIGTCGGFRYFYFEGDVARRELRWFDGAGRLVAQRNSTDDEAYCGGKSRTRFQGKVPRCQALERSEIICGRAGGELPLPIEDVLERRLPPVDAAKP